MANTTITFDEEMILTLFSEETKNIAKRLFDLKKQPDTKANASRLRSFNTDYTLHFFDNDTIILEIIMNSQPSKIKDVYDEHIGHIKTGIVRKYLKPIGIFKNNLDITILYEFESIINTVIEKGLLNSNLKYDKLSFMENAVIAAFSMETAVEAEKYQDTSLISNGIKIDLLMSFNGYPQSFLDDSYGLRGPIAAYILKMKN